MHFDENTTEKIIEEIFVLKKVETPKTIQAVTISECFV